MVGMVSGEVEMERIAVVEFGVREEAIVRAMLKSVVD